MLLWVFFSILTAAAVLLALRALMSGEDVAQDAAEADLAVYKDQLTEIENDRDRGLIGPEEAEAARAELARRILKRSSAAGETQAGPSGSRSSPLASRGGLAVVMSLLVPVVSVGVYLAVGSPGLPSRPHAERMQVSPERASLEELIAKVEEQLRETPEDGRGWDVVAPVYSRLLRFDDAANAYAQSIRLNGETARRLAGFTQSEILANDGLVTERAKVALRRWLTVEPDQPEALFWSAQALEQEGDGPAAVKIYRGLLDRAPEGAPWRQSIEQRIAALSGGEGGSAPSIESPQTAKGGEGDKPAGPNASDVAAAEQMKPEQRQAFINSMVSRLAARLKENADDAGGWMRLIQAYKVLGRDDDARTALRDAREAFAKNEKVQSEFDALAKRLKLGS